jgi:flagellar protein FlaG
MQSKVAPFAATPDSTYGQHPAPHAHEILVEAAEGGAAEEAEARLVIEEDVSTGAVIYRRVDRRTGQVVAEFSRDDVLKMMQDAHYVAGEVIRTTA